MEILTYIQTKENEIADFSISLSSYIKEIAGENKVSAVLILSENAAADYSKLKQTGINKLYILKSHLPFYNKRYHAKLLIELIKKINPEIFILNSTTEGREIAPVVASNLNTGLTADCTKLEIENDKLISTRPTFGGKLMASIICKKTPQMATFRANSFIGKIYQDNEPEIIELDFDIRHDSKIKILEYKKDENFNFTNLQNSKIVLAGGMGLKNKENFDKLKLLAKKMNAAVAGTRKAVDKGFIEREFQVGQTGSFVTPDIYIAFGISGAIHHIVGMENSKKIISINTDKNAPIFKNSDIGIIDDAPKILNELLEKYENK